MHGKVERGVVDVSLPFHHTLRDPLTVQFCDLGQEVIIDMLHQAGEVWRWGTEH